MAFNFLDRAKIGPLLFQSIREQHIDLIIKKITQGLTQVSLQLCKSLAQL